MASLSLSLAYTAASVAAAAAAARVLPLRAILKLPGGPSDATAIHCLLLQ